jgi:hypothetical protein
MVSKGLIGKESIKAHCLYAFVFQTKRTGTKTTQNRFSRMRNLGKKLKASLGKQRTVRGNRLYVYRATGL